MITVSDLTMNFGAQVLFENVNVTFNAGERYGLTGPNGAGKSTFMKIVSGELEPMSGHVSRPRRLGILRQDHTQFDAHRILDVVLMGNDTLWQALSEKETLLAKGDDLSEDEGNRLGELELTIAEEDGYMAETEAMELLVGLGIPAELHPYKLETLQGGDKVRVLLAQALFGKPEALLLDEPTNTLDIGSIRWLESFLAGFEGVLIVISHEPRSPFLERSVQQDCRHRLRDRDRVPRQLRRHGGHQGRGAQQSGDGQRGQEEEDLRSAGVRAAFSRGLTRQSGEIAREAAGARAQSAQ
jgi:ATPase subunit of ABC transporter with duplicated ATPase domains